MIQYKSTRNFYRSYGLDSLKATKKAREKVPTAIAKHGQHYIIDPDSNNFLLSGNSSILYEQMFQWQVELNISYYRHSTHFLAEDINEQLHKGNTSTLRELNYHIYREDWRCEPNLLSPYAIFTKKIASVDFESIVEKRIEHELIAVRTQEQTTPLIVFLSSNTIIENPQIWSIAQKRNIRFIIDAGHTKIPEWLIDCCDVLIQCCHTGFEGIMYHKNGFPSLQLPSELCILKDN